MSMCKTESLCWVLHNVANQLCVNKKGEKNKVVPLWTCKINREEKAIGSVKSKWTHNGISCSQWRLSYNLTVIQGSPQSETVWDLWLPDLGAIKNYFIHLANSLSTFMYQEQQWGSNCEQDIPRIYIHGPWFIRPKWPMWFKKSIPLPKNISYIHSHHIHTYTF